MFTKYNTKRIWRNNITIGECFSMCRRKSPWFLKYMEARWYNNFDKSLCRKNYFKGKKLK